MKLRLSILSALAAAALAVPAAGLADTSRVYYVALGDSLATGAQPAHPESWACRCINPRRLVESTDLQETEFYAPHTPRAQLACACARREDRRLRRRQQQLSREALPRPGRSPRARLRRLKIAPSDRDEIESDLLSDPTPTSVQASDGGRRGRAQEREQFELAGRAAARRE